LKGLEQEQAATVLGVSRKTVWRDIHEAHRKIADALIHGKKIQLAECTRKLEGDCPMRNQGICPKTGGGFCPISSKTLFRENDGPSQILDR
jgi:hypothetical protein